MRYYWEENGIPGFGRIMGMGIWVKDYGYANMG
jgi:hypothetical protein